MSLSDAVSSFPSGHPLTLGGTPDSEKRPHGAEGGGSAEGQSQSSDLRSHTWSLADTPNSMSFQKCLHPGQ